MAFCQYMGKNSNMPAGAVRFYEEGNLDHEHFWNSYADYRREPRLGRSSADLGNKEDIYPLAGAANALVGPIELLIHNASELGPTPLRLLLDTECEDFEHVLGVNLLGPFRLSRVIGGSMALRERGTILHVSSDAAVNAYPNWGAYSVSKAALDHLARLFAAELDARGVRSFSVDPGEMDTRMHAAALPDADPSKLARPAEVAAQIVSLLRARALPNGARIEACNAGAYS